MLYFGDVDAIFLIMMQENYFRITDMKSAGISYSLDKLYICTRLFTFLDKFTGPNLPFVAPALCSLSPAVVTISIRSSVKFSSGTKNQTNKQKNEHH